MNLYHLKDRSGTIVYTFGWREPLTDEQVYRLQCAMGYPPSWVPWYRRAWWAIRRIWRK